MAKGRTDYFSYLLRLWRVHDKGVGTWRVELRSASTGERLGFASLDELFDHLREQTGGASAVCEEKGRATQES